MPDLPGPVRLNPLSYGVDGLRGALSGSFAFGATTDLEPKLDIAFADLIVPQMKDLSGTQMDLMQDAFKTGGSFAAMAHTRAAIRLLREAQNTAFA